MSETVSLKVIARARTDLPEKFGVPRQSGLVPELKARIIFESEYRDVNAVRGLEAFSHIWLVWQFSLNMRQGWSPTVRPPRLGGNMRMGVFATRAPFRPNPVGLSCVRLERIETDPVLGPVLHVACADLVDGTPIFDIKPYIPYTDAVPDAAPGYTARTLAHALEVDIPEALLMRVPKAKRAALRGILMQDPRPGYQDDPARIYRLDFAHLAVSFRVEGAHLSVMDICERECGTP